MATIFVIVDGKTYESVDDPDMKTDEYVESIYGNMQLMGKLKFELKDGGHVIFGDIIRRAVIIVKD